MDNASFTHLNFAGTPILDDEHYHDTTPTGSTQSSQRQRTSQACNKCRERKTKCSGERPVCVRCATRGLVCEYAERDIRISRPPARQRGHHLSFERPLFHPSGIYSQPISQPTTPIRDAFLEHESTSLTVPHHPSELQLPMEHMQHHRVGRVGELSRHRRGSLRRAHSNPNFAVASTRTRPNLSLKSPLGLGIPSPSAFTHRQGAAFLDHRSSHADFSPALSPYSPGLGPGSGYGDFQSPGVLDDARDYFSYCPAVSDLTSSLGQIPAPSLNADEAEAQQELVEQPTNVTMELPQRLTIVVPSHSHFSSPSFDSTHSVSSTESVRAPSTPPSIDLSQLPPIPANIDAGFFPDLDTSTNPDRVNGSGSAPAYFSNFFSLPTAATTETGMEAFLTNKQNEWEWTAPAFNWKELSQDTEQSPQLSFPAQQVVAPQPLRPSWETSL